MSFKVIKDEFITNSLNYTIVGVVIFIISVVLINIKVSHSEENRKKETNINKFLIPAIALSCFFIGCYFISLVVDNNGFQYSGIFYMVVIGIILTIANQTVLNKKQLDKYIKGKKFTVVGLFMALGVSAIVFGFLDNFGLKLGVEALDNTFLSFFLSPFSVHKDFVSEPHRQLIKTNLGYMNDWTTSNWRKIMNQCLRFKDQFDKTKFKDLISAIEKSNCKPLIVPENFGQAKTNEWIDNIRDKFDTIDNSKAMLGNTFSDFIGAILGAAIINLFIYMTNYDGVYTGDDDTDNNFFVKNLNSYAPFMEAFFIALGCLIPVFLNIAMVRKGANINNKRAWIVVGVIGIVIVIMMAISAFGVKNMTTQNKRNSLKKTLKDLKDRLDINPVNNMDETVLSEQIDNLVNNL